MTVSDLSFTLYTFFLIRTLNPNMHIQNIYCKAFKAFQFIIRISWEFNVIILFNVLFCTLVCFILECGYIIWDLSTTATNYMIEKTQRQIFLLCRI